MELSLPVLAKFLEFKGERPDISLVHKSNSNVISDGEVDRKETAPPKQQIFVQQNDIKALLLNASTI